MTRPSPPPGPGPDGGQLLFYQTEDGLAKVEVRLIGDNVWLSLGQLADLYARDKSVISRHIANILGDNELERDSVVAEYATTAADGKTYRVTHYNLDMIIAVGYRVRSTRGTQFRVWATQRLREYIVKGFAMDDERLKKGGDSYFDELLERIRDIRSSERVFWRKVLDIYATSIDYDPRAEASQRFFQTIQNKMHWAAHGQTAAEVINTRADASKPHMGLTTWSGSGIKRADVGIAKNYLTEAEIKSLNLIVSAYLDFAELQATNRRPMTMKDWINKLDDFLRLSERDVLTHAGSISNDAATAKAVAEYERFKANRASLPSPVDADFDAAVEKTTKIVRNRAEQKERRKPKGRKDKGDEA